MAKAPTPAGTAPATDLTAILARLDALEGIADRLADVERLLKDGEALDELKASINSLTERMGKLEPLVDSHTEALAGDTLNAIDGQLAEAEFVGEGDLRADLLKAFRQIEAIANHHNIRLPA